MAPELMERSASDPHVSEPPPSLGTPTVSPFPATAAGRREANDPGAEICTMADLDALVVDLDRIDATLSELR